MNTARRGLRLKNPGTHENSGDVNTIGWNDEDRGGCLHRDPATAAAAKGPGIGKQLHRAKAQHPATLDHRRSPTPTPVNFPHMAWRRFLQI
jgi:hypothetical protein